MRVTRQTTQITAESVTATSSRASQADRGPRVVSRLGTGTGHRWTWPPLSHWRHQSNGGSVPRDKERAADPHAEPSVGSKERAHGRRSGVSDFTAPTRRSALPDSLKLGRVLERAFCSVCYFLDRAVLAVLAHARFVCPDSALERIVSAAPRGVVAQSPSRQSVSGSVTPGARRFRRGPRR